MRPTKTPPVPVPTGQKYCWTCNTVWPVLLFAVDRHQRDKRRPYCRTCEAARLKAYHRRKRQAKMEAGNCLNNSPSQTGTLLQCYHHGLPPEGARLNLSPVAS